MWMCRKKERKRKMTKNELVKKESKINKREKNRETDNK